MQEGVDEGGCWSHDGKQIAFQTKRNGNYEIYILEKGKKNMQSKTSIVKISTIIRLPCEPCEGNICLNRQIMGAGNGFRWQLPAVIDSHSAGEC